MKTIPLAELLDFIGPMVVMREEGTTEHGLAKFERQAQEYLGLHRLAGESQLDLFRRIASWPDGTIVPAMWRNGIYVEIATVLAAQIENENGVKQ